MTEQEKLQAIADSVEMEVSELDVNMKLADLENWDSVAVLSIIAIINEKLGRFPSAADILGYETIGDLMKAMD